MITDQIFEAHREIFEALKVYQDSIRFNHLKTYSPKLEYDSALSVNLYTNDGRQGWELLYRPKQANPWKVYFESKHETVNFDFPTCLRALEYILWQVMDDEEVYNCTSMEDCFDVAIDAL